MHWSWIRRSSVIIRLKKKAVGLKSILKRIRLLRNHWHRSYLLTSKCFHLCKQIYNNLSKMLIICL